MYVYFLQNHVFTTAEQEASNMSYAASSPFLRFRCIELVKYIPGQRVIVVCDKVCTVFSQMT